MSLDEEVRLNATRSETGPFGESTRTTVPLTPDAPRSEAEAGAATATGVSPQKIVFGTDQATVQADVTERQAVEVRPMRYVLFIGLGLAIVAMLIAWAIFR